MLRPEPASAAVERPGARQTGPKAPTARRPATPTPAADSRATRTTPAGDANIRLVSLGAARTGGGGGISCVPYVRQATGMEISGDARLWWANAAGTYERGNRPQPGSVLAFPGSGGMSRGHVAVVEQVVGPREITIHHANWAGPGIRRGSVMRGVRVVDVSDDNNWTAVRVQVGWDSAALGRTYPTSGFIYDRPANGNRMMARAEPAARAASRSAFPQPTLSSVTFSPHALQHVSLSLETLVADRR